MWKNRKGFSMIEAIITIALIGVLVGSSATMIRQIRYASTQKAVEGVSSTLSAFRLESMSQMGVTRYLYIFKLNDGYYMKELTDIKDPTGRLVSEANDQAVNLCGSNITFTRSDGKILGESCDFICIVYTKSGMFDSINSNTTSIRIEGSGSYTIVLDSVSGRHYIE